MVIGTIQRQKGGIVHRRWTIPPFMHFSTFRLKAAVANDEFGGDDDFFGGLSTFDSFH